MCLCVRERTNVVGKERVVGAHPDVVVGKDDALQRWERAAAAKQVSWKLSHAHTRTRTQRQSQISASARRERGGEAAYAELGHAQVPQV
jgi:hypothetical protein